MARPRLLASSWPLGALRHQLLPEDQRQVGHSQAGLRYTDYYIG